MSDSGLGGEDRKKEVMDEEKVSNISHRTQALLRRQMVQDAQEVSRHRRHGVKIRENITSLRWQDG